MYTRSVFEWRGAGGYLYHRKPTNRVLPTPHPPSPPPILCPSSPG